MRERELLGRFAPPAAPDGLRERVLRSASAAAAAAVPPSRADRIWYSKRWRLAWLGALGALILLDLAVARDVTPLRPVRRLREADAAAVALGLRPAGYLGDRVVTDTASRLAAEEIR